MADASDIINCPTGEHQCIRSWVSTAGCKPAFCITSHFPNSVITISLRFSCAENYKDEMIKECMDTTPYEYRKNIFYIFIYIFIYISFFTLKGAHFT